MEVWNLPKETVFSQPVLRYQRGPWWNVFVSKVMGVRIGEVKGLRDLQSIW